MKITSNPTHVANKGYNGFPIKQRKQFSSTIGHLLPVYYDYLSPGDKVTCGAELFSRFQPMVAPWMGKIEEHIDWFFVPMEQIYSYFGDAFYGIQDFKSDFVGASTSRNANSMPAFDKSVMSSLFAGAFRGGSVDNVKGEILSANDAVCFRLLDHLGFPIKRMWKEFFYSFINGGAGDWYPFDVALWTLAAYQKIWSDHYRLSDWQENDSFLYNFDSFVKSDTDRANVSRFKNLCTIHRVPYKRDYFTYSLPSPLFDNKSFNAFGGDGLNAVNQWLSKISSVVTFNANNSTSNGDATLVRVPGIASTVSIRTAFAMEKMLEITRRAGKHYDAQTLAHFGINVPSGLSGESQFLGGMQVGSHVDEVFSTAQTSSVVDGEDVLTPLGQMAGKGAMYGSKGNIKFEAKCHGVLMAIFYVIPDIVYEQSGLDRLNSYVRTQDFFRPELDDLGMQPLFSYEAEFPIDYRPNLGVFSSSVLSWKYRYSELKSKYNVAFGNLIGDMKPWTLARESVLENGNYNWSALTVDSTLLNRVMLVPYTGNVASSEAIPLLTNFTGYNNPNLAYQYGQYIYNQIYSRDPLMHDLYIQVNKASKMSTFGLPSL